MQRRAVLVYWVSRRRACLANDGSNAYDEIDYDACEMDVTGLGRCAD